MAALRGALLGAVAAVLLPAQRSFELREAFGVAHPRQIVDFDIPGRIDAGNSYMIGPDGAEVTYQVLRDGKVAVQTDLPANARRTWRLLTGRKPAADPNAVRIEAKSGWYEITNGLTGVRVARSPAETTAPIQGILYRDGTWTANGPNYLHDARGARLNAKKMEIRFLESGPLKVVVQVAYEFDRPDLVYGNNLLIGGGAGYYHSTIEVQAGQPSILIEDDTDMDLRYHLNVYEGLRPDQARYRGHHSTTAANGYEADGRQYRQWHERPAMDAFRDLQYDKAAPSSYTSTDPYIRRMAVWDPWVYDSGWYWQLYQAGAGESSNLLGIFAGRASRAVGAAHNGPGIFTTPAGENGKPAAGITFECNRRAPDARVYPRVRIHWGIFTGVKGQDLGDPHEVQNIARQMNLHGGIHLNKVHRLKLAYEDPREGYSSLYMNPEVARRIGERVRTDTGYYRYLYNAEPTARPLLDMWRDGSGKKLKEVVGNVTGLAAKLLDALVNGDGIYNFQFHYWHGGLEMSRQAMWINSVLLSEMATEEDREKVKAAAVLFASVLADNDFVPMFDGHGLNLGTANMPVQQGEYRDLYAVMLSFHPMMQGRVEGAKENALANLDGTVNEHGAHMAATHYIGASMGPLLSTLQQLQAARVTDPFRTESKLARFAEFYLNLLTPREPRFGGWRKLISVGDSATESSELYGQLGTGFRDVDAELSARLMGAWALSGEMHSGFHGTTILKIDEDLPRKDARLGSATFPGWYTVLRHGWGSRNESAVWLVNGDYYRDHAHEDNGNVVMYALGAPLSIDWGSMYYPQAAGGFHHSVPALERGLRFAWNSDNTPLNGGSGRWRNAVQEAFESFTLSARAEASFRSAGGTVWRREVNLINANEDYPVIRIRDRFDGAEAGGAKIFSLNLMSQGTVETPAGPMSPPARQSVYSKAVVEPPSAGPVFALGAGVQRLGFTGQWGVDWDLYTAGSEAMEAMVGAWGHDWHPNREQSEFARTNGRPFQERQHILRLRGKDEFDVLLLPYRKGERREVTVRREGSNLVITSGEETTVLGEGWHAFQGAGKKALTVAGAGAARRFGMEAKGGAVEVVVEGERVVITAHGPAGMRRVKVPGEWEAKAEVGRGDEGEFQVDYAGGEPLRVELGMERK